MPSLCQRVGSNYRPLRYECSALTTELRWLVMNSVYHYSVAGPGLEPGLGDYEPPVLPLHYPAYALSELAYFTLLSVKYQRKRLATSPNWLLVRIEFEVSSLSETASLVLLHQAELPQFLPRERD